MFRWTGCTVKIIFILTMDQMTKFHVKAVTRTDKPTEDSELTGSTVSVCQCISVSLLVIYWWDLCIFVFET